MVELTREACASNKGPLRFAHHSIVWNFSWGTGTIAPQDMVAESEPFHGTKQRQRTLLTSIPDVLKDEDLGVGVLCLS